MTSIERTAYPYISANKIIAQKTLATCYVLTKSELDYLDKYIRGNKLRFNFAIQLKVFQNFGYFIDISEIPTSILGFIKKQLKLPYNLQPAYDHPKTLSRHRERIRECLEIKPWSSFVRQGTMFCIILLSRLISFVSNQMYTRVNAIQTKT